MTTHKPESDYPPQPPDDQTDLQSGMNKDFEKLAADDEKEGDKKGKKKGKTYTEDPNDPNYVEPRLRPDWTPDQPG
jgi:hypothetical protein